MAANSVWTSITTPAKAIVAAGAALVAVGGLVGVLSGHFTLPPKNERAIEVQAVKVDTLTKSIDALQYEQRSSNEKLDRVLCILEGTDPLTCERAP